MGKEDVNVGEVTAEATKFDPIMKAKSKTTCLMFAINKMAYNQHQQQIAPYMCLSVCLRLPNVTIVSVIRLNRPESPYTP